MIDPDLPFIDLHRHLDGSVRLETILDLGRQHNLPLPAWDIDGLRPHVQVTGSPDRSGKAPGVMAFIEKFEWMTKVLVDLDACWRVAYENIQDAHREGIDYIELRFSPWFMAETHELDPAGVVAAVVQGARAGADEFGVKVKLIGIISRTYGPDVGWRELGALLTQRDHLIALDLAGDEARYPCDLFVKHFQKARDVGWRITVHAGEAAGPESIWQALRLLGAERIGHGVTAAQDHTLMEYMAKHRIGVETSLTSNVQTCTVHDYALHPARDFLHQGLLVTLNTDDPGISAIDLHHEYEIAAPAAGLSPGQIRQAQRNALDVAFLTNDERQRLASRAAG